MMWMLCSFAFSSLDAPTCSALPPKPVAHVSPRTVWTKFPLRVVRSESVENEPEPVKPLTPVPTILTPPVAAPVVSASKEVGPSTLAPLLRLALPLFGVAAVALLLAIWQKRRVPRVPDAEIEILAGRTLGPKHRLHVVRVDGKRLLVSLAPDGLRLMCELDDHTSAAQSFEQTLDAHSLGVTGAPPIAMPDASPEIEGLMRMRRARAGN